MSWRPVSAALVVLCVVRCSNSTGPTAGRTLTLRGTLPAASVVGSRSGAVAASTLAQATQVAVVYVSGYPAVSPIANGAFSIPVLRNSPAGLIFADASQQAIGYLSLGNGIDALPLNVASDTLTEINFQALSASGAIVTPAHNPLGAELPLSPADIAALAQSNGYFAQVAENADVDGDGKVDALSGRLYWLSAMSFYAAGSFPFSVTTTPTVDLMLPNACTKLNLNVFETAFPSSVTFQFPDASTVGGNGGPDPNGMGGPFGTGGGSYTSACVYPYLPAGLYHVAFGPRLLSFTMPDPGLASSRILLPIPTVTLSGNSLTAIDWTYRTPTSAAAVDPAALLDQPIIMVKGYDALGSIIIQWQSGANRAVLPAGATHVNISPALLWSRVTEIDMNYIDTFRSQPVFQYAHLGTVP